MAKYSSIDGYTLVEVVIVIIIMGILASVAVKSLSVATDTARTKETMKEMRFQQVKDF